MQKCRNGCSSSSSNWNKWPRLLQQRAVEQTPLHTLWGSQTGSYPWVPHLTCLRPLLVPLAS